MRKAAYYPRAAAMAMLALFAAVAMAGCSSLESEAVADHHVGPVGPTYPSGYYFECTITPHSIVPTKDGSFLTILTRVWDSNGNLAAGVPVQVAAGGVAHRETTGYDGILLMMIGYKIEAGADIVYGHVKYVTVNIEDSFLTIPFQLIPNQTG